LQIKGTKHITYTLLYHGQSVQYRAGYLVHIFATENASLHNTAIIGSISFCCIWSFRVDG